MEALCQYVMVEAAGTEGTLGRMVAQAKDSDLAGAAALGDLERPWGHRGLFAWQPKSQVQSFHAAPSLRRLPS